MLSSYIRFARELGKVSSGIKLKAKDGNYIEPCKQITVVTSAAGEWSALVEEKKELQKVAYQFH